MVRLGRNSRAYVPDFIRLVGKNSDLCGEAATSQMREGKDRSRRPLLIAVYWRALSFDSTLARAGVQSVSRER